ncbi:MAG: PEP-CTERM sorting domain-containing protein [Chromatiales bacterium]|nr:PEP-CTERM sorting domain-containing protein [Chromatiales bacterium]
MKQITTAIVSAIALTSFATPSLAAPLIVDGNLGDWGILTADNNGSSYNLNSGGDWTLLGSMEEDSNDRSNNYTVGPNEGGQNYDAEFLGVALQGSTLYIGISTGQRPDNGKAFFGPGDIRIELGNGTVFGIEVGGGIGSSSGFSDAIEEGAYGSLYELNPHGVTTGHTTLTSQLAGSLWLNPDWRLDPIDDAAGVEPVQILPGTGTNLGLVDYIFTRDAFTNQHAIIELALDISRLGLVGNEQLAGLSVDWRPSCGNDELHVVAAARSRPFNNELPEPAGIGLLALGLGLIGRLRKKPV